MRLWASAYTLKTVHAANSRAAGLERHGTLLRVETQEGFGYADLHPWPELGDEPLARQLEGLRESRTTSLSRRSLELARIDAAFRSRKQNAFGSMEIPESHFLIPDLLTIGEGEFPRIWERGFRSLKFKLGHRLSDELKRLNELRDRLPMFRIRLDFNGQLRPDDYVTFTRELADSIRSSIEFVEDPVPWDAGIWRQLRFETELPLALDRVADTELSMAADASPFRWCILKPATQEPTAVEDLARRAEARLVVTSYMDHPVGQVTAAFEAARLAASNTSLGTCGLLTHFNLFTSEWTENLRVQGARLLAPAGLGFGFDSLFEKQRWTPLQ